MTFTDELWHATEDIRAEIVRHPFVTGLGDGTLSPDRFGYYLGQDALYLAHYGRVLALCAGRTEDPDEVLFWSGSAAGALTVERDLHARYVDVGAAERSPTCTAYTSYLAALAAGGSYPRLVAGVLPCFWIYEYVGRRLLEHTGDNRDHPYADWIATYADPAFAAATHRAREVTDVAAGSAGALERQRMLDTFVTCTRYEWMFWDAAWRMEAWPV